MYMYMFGIVCVFFKPKNPFTRRDACHATRQKFSKSFTHVEHKLYLEAHFRFSFVIVTHYNIHWHFRYERVSDLNSNWMNEMWQINEANQNIWMKWIWLLFGFATNKKERKKTRAEIAKKNQPFENLTESLSSRWWWIPQNSTFYTDESTNQRHHHQQQQQHQQLSVCFSRYSKFEDYLIKSFGLIYALWLMNEWNGENKWKKKQRKCDETWTTGNKQTNRIALI